MTGDPAPIAIFERSGRGHVPRSTQTLMATNHGLRHVNEGPAYGGHFAVLRVVSLATIAAATAIFAALIAGAAHHDNGPAPRFLHAALGGAKQSGTLPTRTLARMRSSVTHDGVRVAAPWAKL